MRFLGIHLKIPRRDVEHFVDLMECNGFICDVDPVVKTEDPLNGGPRHVIVSISEDDVVPFDDEMCGSCGGWDGEHVDGCDGEDTCLGCGVPLEAEAPKDEPSSN